MDTHTVLDTISIILMSATCGMLGYVIRMHAELTRQQKQLKEADRRFQNVVSPMALFLARIHDSGQVYSEERFRDYLEEQGTSYEQWHAEAELLIGRKI